MFQLTNLAHGNIPAATCMCCSYAPDGTGSSESESATALMTEDFKYVSVGQRISYVTIVSDYIPYWTSCCGWPSSDTRARGESWEARTDVPLNDRINGNV